MAGKACALVSPRLHFALDKLSKNALIDLVADQARLDIGQEDASDADVVRRIQQWLEPIIRARSDRKVNLADAMMTWDRHVETYHHRAAAMKAAEEHRPPHHISD
jgi:hypothetical protein